MLVAKGIPTSLSKRLYVVLDQFPETCSFLRNVRFSYKGWFCIFSSTFKSSPFHQRTEKGLFDLPFEVSSENRSVADMFV
jgi:hypothetical protein